MRAHGYVGAEQIFLTSFLSARHVAPSASPLSLSFPCLAGVRRLHEHASVTRVTLQLHLGHRHREREAEELLAVVEGHDQVPEVAVRGQLVVDVEAMVSDLHDVAALAPNDVRDRDVTFFREQVGEANGRSPVAYATASKTEKELDDSHKRWTYRWGPVTRAVPGGKGSVLCTFIFLVCRRAN